MNQNPIIQRQQDRYTDKLIQSSFSYWSAILTVNGLILAFFSSDILRKDFVLDPFIILLLFFTVISIGLILYNFRKIRDMYFNLGSMTNEQFRNMSNEERVQAFQHDQSSFKWRKRRETTIEVLLIVEGILILALVVYSKYFMC